MSVNKLSNDKDNVKAGGRRKSCQKGSLVPYSKIRILDN